MHRNTPSRRIGSSRLATGSATIPIEAVIGLALLAAVVVIIVIALTTPWLLALLVMAALFLLLCAVITQTLDFVLRLMSRW